MDFILVQEKEIPIMFIYPSFLCLFFAITFSFSNEPSLTELEEWAKFLGNKTAKIVYMTRGSNEIMVHDLVTGDITKVADFGPANTEWGMSGSVTWSPNGMRIVMMNDKQVKVMNADGTNQVLIANTNLSGDLFSCDWGDNSSIVYSVGDSILQTVINATNEIVSTKALITTPPEGSKGYCSVSMSGDYLAYIDWRGNISVNGGHRPLVFNVVTKELHDVVKRNSDGCQLRIKPDGSGTVIYCEWSHNIPATIKNWDGIQIDSIAPINEPVDNYSIQHMQWSNDTNYIMVMGQSDEPKHAWVLRMSDRVWMYMGSKSYHPDLWIDNADDLIPISHSGTQDTKKKSLVVRKTINGKLELFFPDVDRYEITIFALNGQKLFSGYSDGTKPISLSVFKNGIGICVLSVKKSEMLFTQRKILL